ncbi:helix-turn-helix transcriptional regulator [Bacillus xiapuensis]|uniref:Helix-turn-helix transcriptional regulator n=1 Tax=Bacillus xiapuensis TaxID=2014075 RepID=A0ABU6ND71_9BACI|nr:helix-turn-helix transcriptional regulator [Bacillus xiapuensis]
MEDIFAIRFKELRMKNNLSMQAMGEKLGLGKSIIAAYESGEKKPKLPRLAEIADIFNVSADYLLGITDEPFGKKQTRNLAILLSESSDFHYNGIPLSEPDLKLFNALLERILKDVKSVSNDSRNEV